MTSEQERPSTKKRESTLHGLLRKYGTLLPFADRVIACFQTEKVSFDAVHGVLFSFDARVPLVFERHWVIGNVDLLPSPGERTMLRVTARPWVDESGQITLKAKHFMILPPRTSSGDVHETGDVGSAGATTEQTNA